MTRLRRTLAPVLAAAACVGCANMEMTRTGFLEDYDQLRSDPERAVSFVPDEVHAYDAPDADWLRYDSVVVEPVVFDAPADREVPEPDAQASLARKFTRILKERLGRDLEVVDEPGPSSVVVRAAITDVDPSNLWVNWIGVILVVPPDMGGISGELEVIDGATGERLLAMTATREGTPFLFLECFSVWGHARHGMKKWARAVAETIRPPD